ncbi:Ribosome production factor 1 [Geodia barretti]|uniref:Ribosome production factor 1 n=1 Tax=Geodia barretti TaxID=519541 RepID=A0AA35SUA6_GEOBA|nr:Ribosome production factor 1 [Geodia barretti]
MFRARFLLWPSSYEQRALARGGVLLPTRKIMTSYPRVRKLGEMAKKTARVLARSPLGPLRKVSRGRPGNKVRRLAAWREEKKRKMKEKRERREQRQKEREKLGEDAPPKLEPRTIENTRVVDETVVVPDDEEVIQDEKTDEFAGYFDHRVTPKVLLLTVKKPSGKTVLLLNELNKCIPNSEFKLRWGAELKKVIPEAVERDFTDILVVNEDQKRPNGLVAIHLPSGAWEGDAAQTGGDTQQLHHSTRSQCGEDVCVLVPSGPPVHREESLHLHNQRDFIFIRHHRYIFRGAEKVGLQELGPRLTLKLRSLQEGTFDSKHGEYIWVHKRKQMDTSRRKFHL